MWFIGVEVEQETSAPPPKKNPGSAPGTYYRPVSGKTDIRDIHPHPLPQDYGYAIIAQFFFSFFFFSFFFFFAFLFLMLL